VEIIGGEPLEEPGLAITLSLLEQLAADPKCQGVIISTAVISTRIFEIVLPYVSRIYLSVDISNDRQNRKHVPIQRIATLVSMCKSAGVELSIATVMFGDESADELKEFIDALVGAGVSSVGLGHITVSAKTPHEVTIAVNQYYQLFRLRLAYRPKIQIIGTVLDSLELHLAGNARKAACECGRNSVVIEPDGQLNVGLCFDHKRDTYTPEKFLSIRSDRPGYLLKGACSGCALWDVCQGGCVSEAVRLNGTPFARAEIQCQILLGVAERLEADLLSL
jgi:radical SAM protein with 4Fe4S-binding SPASM domain